MYYSSLMMVYLIRHMSVDLSVYFKYTDNRNLALRSACNFPDAPCWASSCFAKGEVDGRLGPLWGEGVTSPFRWAEAAGPVGAWAPRGAAQAPRPNVQDAQYSVDRQFGGAFVPSTPRPDMMDRYISSWVNSNWACRVPRYFTLEVNI